MDTLDGMRAVIAVAEELSFTRAGRRLGVTTKLVSRYVGQVEAKLGAQLFRRTTRSVTLTDVGQAYLTRCRSLLEQFDELEALVQARQTKVAGRIRVTAPTGFGSRHLTAALGPFLAKYPQVVVDLHLSDHRVALVEEGLDLAVRIGMRRDSSLISRKLADMPLVVCAAPSYLQARGRPRDVRDLSTHACLIDTNITPQQTWHFRVDGEDVPVRVDGPARVNSPLGVAEMAVQGLGVALCPRYVVRDHLAAGRLEALFQDEVALDFSVFALYPPNRHLTRRVRLLIDHLAEALG